MRTLLFFLQVSLLWPFVNSDGPLFGRHPRPVPPQPAKSGRWLLHESTWGVLSTVSTLPGIAGAPFGNPQSLVDGPYRDGLFGDNSTGIPYFFVSELDVSQQDASANSLVSLTVSEAGVSSECAMLDPESPLCIRLTVTGDLVEVVDEEETAFAMQALFQRHPQMQSASGGMVGGKSHVLKACHLYSAGLFCLACTGSGRCS